MRVVAGKSPYRYVTLTSDDGSRFVSLSLFNPFSPNCCVLDFYFMVDKLIPGFELNLTLLFFTVFYRSNKPEALRILEELDREVESEEFNACKIEEVLDKLEKSNNSY